MATRKPKPMSKPSNPAKPVAKNMAPKMTPEQMAQMKKEGYNKFYASIATKGPGAAVARKQAASRLKAGRASDKLVAPPKSVVTKPAAKKAKPMPAKPGSKKGSAQSLVYDRTKPLPPKQNMPYNTTKPKTPLRKLGVTK